MLKRIFLLTIGILVSLSPFIDAKESNPIFSRLESGSISVENPFKSQLPVKEEKIEETTATVEDNFEGNDDSKEEEEYFEAEAEAEPLMEIPLMPEQPLPDIIISGIIWNSDRPQAIINGKIVDIGDTVQEIQIIGIQKAGIDGLFNGREVTLKP